MLTLANNTADAAKAPHVGGEGGGTGGGRGGGGGGGTERASSRLTWSLAAEVQTQYERVQITTH